MWAQLTDVCAHGGVASSVASCHTAALLRGLLRGACWSVEAARGGMWIVVSLRVACAESGLRVA